MTWDAAGGGDPQSGGDLDAQVLAEQVGEPLAYHLLGESELYCGRPRRTVDALNTTETLLGADRVRDGQRDAERPEDDQGDREAPPCASGAEIRIASITRSEATAANSTTLPSTRRSRGPRRPPRVRRPP